MSCLLHGTITIQHLLHHTSGLRDHISLLGLAGRRLYEDVLTEDDVLNVVWRQKALNFVPGDEFLYSNTGYVVLGLIVQRVSGKSLASFAKERIFDPLGMRHTQIHENYGDLLQGRAYSYVKGLDDRYRYMAFSASCVGAAGVFTTVRDLTRWDQNLNDREYFLKAADFQGTFTANSQGNVVGMVVRHDGIEQVGKRIDAATAKAVEDLPKRRLVENVPLPGSEAALRRVLDELRASPDYARMTPMLAQAVREALPSIQAELGSLGRALSVEFIGVGARGEDVYSVHFSNGDAEWRIRLTNEGMLEWLEHHPFKEALRLPLASVSTLRTRPGGEPTTIELINRTNDPLRVNWIDREGSSSGAEAWSRITSKPSRPMYRSYSCWARTSVTLSRYSRRFLD